MITEISKVIFFGESKIQLRTSRGTPWLAEITPHGGVSLGKSEMGAAKVWYFPWPISKLLSG